MTLSWYLIVQLITLITLPLAWRIFANLPDRGYAFAKSLGILLVGVTLWLGASYGVLRNDTGGAWMALLIVAAVSLATGWRTLRNTQHATRNTKHALPYILAVELLFAAAFFGWAYVRSHDPAVNHTEQPMDLMFMNGIFTSATFPPKDPWLAGYAISYYYMGYWLVMTLARLAGQLPEVAYNLGQACWYGLLLVGSFGVGANLWEAGREKGKRQSAKGKSDLEAATELDPQQHATHNTPFAIRHSPFAILSGLLSALAVGVMGNLQGIWEWLHANGVDVSGPAAFFGVRNFPENAVVTGNWFIGTDWWWWRSSRVISDVDLAGNHLEVIDEFPMFSYILGDNHPHVLAMPFVILVIGLALNLFLGRGEGRIAGGEEEAGGVQAGGGWLHTIRNTQQVLAIRHLPFAILIVVVGSLIPLNTWDFPPYWLLLGLAALFAVARRAGFVDGLKAGGMLFGTVLIGAIVLYLPYFLTAQSQAGGFVPNLFHSTKLPQFFLMFGPFLLGVGALIWLAWIDLRPDWSRFGLSLGLSWGLPILFLAASLALLLAGDPATNLLGRIPGAATDTAATVLARRGGNPWTFLLLGGMVAAVASLLWQRLAAKDADPSPATTFALLLAGIGLLLVYAPEFVYLLDNFGPNMRMNTVFKFYYQGWLLLGLAGIFGALGTFTRRSARSWPAVVLGIGTFLLMAVGMAYPMAGIPAKAGLFRNPQPTLDAIAYIAQWNPDEYAAIQWVRANTSPDAVILEAKGASYRADYNRISTATGRATLMGWDGHEAQWRGEAFGQMAQGRDAALDAIFRQAPAQSFQDALTAWGIDYVYIGPIERQVYNLSPGSEARFDQLMDLVFQQGDVRIYRTRG